MHNVSILRMQQPKKVLGERQSAPHNQHFVDRQSHSYLAQKHEKILHSRLNYYLVFKPAQLKLQSGHQNPHL